MIFEVSNPSDPVTLESDDAVLASVATILLGRGLYGLSDESGELVLPMLAFCGDGSLAEWCAENGVSSIDTYVDANRLRLAECLETAVVASAKQRRSVLVAIEAAGGDKAKAMSAYNEARRSSMNDICGYAKTLADHFRKKAGV